jgi:hypothetical protein
MYSEIAVVSKTCSDAHLVPPSVGIGVVSRERSDGIVELTNPLHLVLR